MLRVFDCFFSLLLFCLPFCVYIRLQIHCGSAIAQGGLATLVCILYSQGCLAVWRLNQQKPKPDTADLLSLCFVNLGVFILMYQHTPVQPRLHIGENHAVQWLLWFQILFLVTSFTRSAFAPSTPLLCAKVPDKLLTTLHSALHSACRLLQTSLLIRFVLACLCLELHHVRARLSILRVCHLPHDSYISDEA